jgi:hypothetical protein
MEVNLFGNNVQVKNPASQEFRIIQIGAGGTGSYLLAPLSKYVGSVRKTGRECAYLVYDMDTVSESNTLRQNFSKRSVGDLKVSALSDVYDNFTGVDIKIDEKGFGDFEGLLTSNKLRRNVSNIIIGCVDNTEARVFLYEKLLEIKMDGKDFPLDWVYVDAGNHTRGGQLFVVQAFFDENGDRILIEPDEGFVKVFTDANENAVKAPGCTEMGDQSIMANVMAATNTYNVVTEYMTYGFSTVKSLYFSRYTLNINGEMMLASMLGIA